MHLCTGSVSREGFLPGVASPGRGMENLGGVKLPLALGSAVSAPEGPERAYRFEFQVLLGWTRGLYLLSIRSLFCDVMTEHVNNF